MSDVLLHPTEARCATGGAGCPMRLRCARALAPAGSHALTDYAAGEGGNSALCLGYYDIGHARWDAEEKYGAAARTRVRAPVQQRRGA